MELGAGGVETTAVSLNRFASEISVDKSTLLGKVVNFVQSAFDKLSQIATCGPFAARETQVLPVIDRSINLRRGHQKMPERR